MQLPPKYAFIPLLMFLMICMMFALLLRNGVNLIHLSYDACHLLHGLVFPLAFGYLYLPARAKTDHIPLRMLIEQIRAFAIQNWPRALARSIVRDLKRGIPWSPWAGAFWVASYAVFNEVVIDPSTNGIPFTSAYSNLVADLLGISVVLVIAHLLTRRPSSGLKSS